MAKTQKTTAFIDDTIRKTVAGDFKGIDDVFSHLLNPIFGEDNFTRGTDELIRSNPEYRKMAELTHIQSIFHRGSFDVNGNDLQIYEIVMDDHSQLRRARAGIQTIVRKFLGCDQSALIVFHYKNPQGRSWRLSYVIHDKSTAKRYTYLLGQKHPTRTAAEQLSTLMKNKQLVTDDILKAFSVETLTKEFYTQIKDWYVWAQKEQFNVTFPNDVGTAQDDRQHLEEHLIRLITRLIFVWFIKQKGLAADELFEPAELKNMLVDFDAEAGKGGTGCRPQCEKTSSYYNAILQNLFFATLNKAMDKRGFAYDGTDPERRREEYGIKTLYRYRSQFTDSGAESMLQHFKKTPFLNGGLFECLDKSDPMADNPNRIIYSDGFSRNDKKNDGNFACRAFIPNVLFFSRDEKQPGIIEILKRYHFTIEENSDDDAVVALDPELLGKIFENLLAYYNPETKDTVEKKDTVKKSTGSFYTPREIVRFMTESSIASYLKSKCPDMQDKIDLLFTDEWDAKCLKASQRKGITEALLSMKTLDPACGSGAFPMGMMQVMLELLQKLDPDVVNHLYEYKKKIIENCLYGVDIQTIAVQITKLRCFISLIIDSEPDPDADNLGITPLPNLETNFVAANSLIPLSNKPKSLNEQTLFDIWSREVNAEKKHLLEIRHRHFNASGYEEKVKLREADKESREKLARLFAENKSVSSEDIARILQWDPYAQNKSNSFFDPEWMLGVVDRFDIVIGNPPYVKIQHINAEDASKYKKIYLSATGKFDIYVLFVERSFSLVKSEGIICYIHPHKFLNSEYGKGLRKFLSAHKGIQKIISFGTKQLFNTAITYTGIFTYTQGKDDHFLYTNVESEKLNNLQFNKFNWETLSEPWSFNTISNDSILKKIYNQKVPLLNIFKGIYQGLITNGDDIFILKGHIENNLFYGYSDKTHKHVILEAEIMKPLLKGEHIKRYSQPESDLYVIYPHVLNKKGQTQPIKENDFLLNYPMTYNYLLQFKDELYHKKIEYKTNPKYWYSLHRSRKIDIFDSNKIITPQLQNYCNFSYDTMSMYPDAGGYMMIIKNEYSEDIFCYYAIINSALFYHFIKSVSNVFRSEYYYFKTNYIKMFRFPEVIRSDAKIRLSQLVQYILSNRSKKKNFDKIIECEKEIDNIIFQMYNLNDCEIQEISKRYDIC